MTYRWRRIMSLKSLEADKLYRPTYGLNATRKQFISLKFKELVDNTLRLVGCVLRPIDSEVI